MPLQLRRGTDAQRTSQVFAAGELIYITDTEALYIGDGSTAGGVAVANLSAADIRSISSGMLTGGAHTGISFTVNGNFIDAVVDPDLSNYQGVIRASAFNGTLVDDSSTILVDAVDSKINLDGTVKGDIIPDADSAYDIGSSGAKFKDLYLSGSSLYLGSAQITAVGSAINLPLGSTVNGVPIGSGGGTGDGVIEGSTYKINIASDDSSLMINTDTEEIVASGGFFGDLTGSVTGNVIGNVTGNVLGNLLGNVTGDLRGSVFADDSSMVFDGTEGKFIGAIDNNIIESRNITANKLILEGLDPSGNKAGLKIVTDGNADDTYDLLTIEGSKEDNNGMSVVYSRSRGTPTSKQPLQAGDEILGQFWFGADSDVNFQISAGILVYVDDTPSSGAVPGGMTLATANSSGVITPAININSRQVIDFANNTLVAGGGSGQVDISSVATYLEIQIGGTTYAIPAYAINP